MTPEGRKQFSQDHPVVERLGVSDLKACEGAAEDVGSWMIYRGLVNDFKNIMGIQRV